MNSSKTISIFIVLFVVNTLFANNVTTTNEVVLKETQGWTIDTIAPGFIHYHYATYYRPHSAYQNVNILEIDYTNPSYNIELKYASPADSLSSVAKQAGAIGGINGSYELDATFVKTANKVNSQVILPSSHLRFWKHEGAFFYNAIPKEAKIAYGTNNSYMNSNFPNILSGAPMLIDNYIPVGENFIGDVTGINLNSLEYEDYRRHQGVRHPRTAVALTEGNKLLLIVADGRRSGFSEGMTASELTQFLARYFKPRSALNIDGGGSSTMYIEGSNKSITDVINYPTDNSKFDHYGQRSVRTFILVKKTSESSDIFAGGSGTISDPFLINTVAHMQSMHSADYSTPKHFKLTADIDMDGVNWIPINSADPYPNHIHFDGNGHIIKNLKVEGVPYASLFGVLCGSCKNLGVINANIQSTNGGGIIAGYAGLKGPNKPTGIISNCFTTGNVSGTDAVGGIVGNIGKPNGDNYSGVKNCYSTANVTTTNTSGNSRAGGIAGIVFENGILENNYTTGTVTSSMYGAGGIAGWCDASIVGCVALNTMVKNTTTGNMGRIAAFMGSISGVQAQGINCWGYDGVVLDDAGVILTEADLNQGEVTTRNAPYDGISKTREFLSDPYSYFLELNWDFASDNNVWAQTMLNGYPMLQWLANRSDYLEISGLGVNTGTNQAIIHKAEFSIEGKTVSIKGSGTKDVKIFSISGQLIHHTVTSSFVKSIELNDVGVYIIVLQNYGTVVSKKIIVR